MTILLLLALIGWAAFLIGFTFGAYWAGRKLERTRLTVLFFGDEPIDPADVGHLRDQFRAARQN